MGYDAYVNCNCYKSGLTTDPPYKEYLKIDEDGIYLNIEYLYKSDEDLYWQMNDEFSLWKKSACPHEDMEEVSLGVANMTGMAHFRGLLSNLGGEDRFPVLTEYLPVCNGGCLPAEYAIEALAEVDFILNSGYVEEYLVLREKESKNIIASTNNLDSYYPFMWTGRKY